jgi:hypothetical protein
MSGDDEARDAGRRDGPDGSEEDGDGDADGDANANPEPEPDAGDGATSGSSGAAELTAFLAATNPGRGLGGDGDRRDRLRERVADLREDAEALRAVDLSNDDEPVTTFVPHRGADGDAGADASADGDAGEDRA